MDSTRRRGSRRDGATCTRIGGDGVLARDDSHEYPHRDDLDAERRRNSLTRDCLRAWLASRALMKASSIVSASVINSGSRGEVTINPPSRATSSFSTSLPSLTVYRV